MKFFHENIVSKKIGAVFQTEKKKRLIKTNNKQSIRRDELREKKNNNKDTQVEVI